MSLVVAFTALRVLAERGYIAMPIVVKSLFKSSVGPKMCCAGVAVASVDLDRNNSLVVVWSGAPHQQMIGDCQHRGSNVSYPASRIKCHISPSVIAFCDDEEGHPRHSVHLTQSRVAVDIRGKTRFIDPDGSNVTHSLAEIHSGHSLRKGHC
jgi:hypothetical protein